MYKLLTPGREDILTAAFLLLLEMMMGTMKLQKVPLLNYFISMKPTVSMWDLAVTLKLVSAKGKQ